MPPPVTPIVGADTFVLNGAGEVCLIRRSDNGLWALPGGSQDLSETPVEYARREFKEETGLDVQITGMLGVFSSRRYEAITNVNRGRQVTHILFTGRLIGGKETPSEETPEIGWFAEGKLPPMSDGHEVRVRFGFETYKNPMIHAHYE